MNNSYKITTFLDATHLVNQHYQVCVRQGAGKEVICYIPCTSIAGEGAVETIPSNQVSI